MGAVHAAKFLVAEAGAVLFSFSPALAAEDSGQGPSEIIFPVRIVLLLLVGRLLGEIMQWIGRPAIMGQLLKRRRRTIRLMWPSP